MERIDELDRKILKIITQNARIPFRDVADICGVSRAAVHQRVQKMFDSGAIIGSGYQVNPKMLGYNLCAYIGITLDKGNMYNAVSAELEKIPEVVESQFTLGAYSMLIKLYAKEVSVSVRFCPFLSVFVRFCPFPSVSVHVDAERFDHIGNNFRG